MDWLNRLKQMEENIPKQVDSSPIARNGRIDTKERAAESRKRFCYWREKEVEDCRLPCWYWSKDKGDGRTCEHFRAYMISIGRWSA